MIRVCKTTEENLPKTYLKIFNGVFGLTESELELTAVIIKKYREYGMQGLREPFLSKFVFSTDERKDMCSLLGEISNQNLGNKFKQLTDKGVLRSDGNLYILDASILPEKEITFKFELVNDKK